MHPKFEVDKVYVAKIKGIPSREKIRQLQRGVMLEDGKTAPARAKVLSIDKSKQTAIVELTIHEGKNRQVRRMFDAIGHSVLKLKRERYGPLDLRGLNAGEARELTAHEVKQLYSMSQTGK
jgi:23S rRNA pseudouridine2605 synthase